MDLLDFISPTYPLSQITQLRKVEFTHSPQPRCLSGMRPTGLRSLHLPSFKTEERESGISDISGLMDGGVMDRGAYQFEARSWSYTPQRSRLGGKPCSGGGETASYRGIDFRWAH